MGGLRRWIDWLFVDRRTGRMVVAQFPNPALWLFLAATALRWLAEPDGVAGAAVQVAATGALVWWSADEALRGVNPWRRLLGVVVLAGQILRIVR